MYSFKNWNKQLMLFVARVTQFKGSCHPRSCLAALGFQPRDRQRSSADPDFLKHTILWLLTSSSLRDVTTASIIFRGLFTLETVSFPKEPSNCTARTKNCQQVKTQQHRQTAFKDHQSLFSGPTARPVVVQLLSRVQLSVASWTAARQAPLSVRFPKQEY